MPNAKDRSLRLSEELQALAAQVPPLTDTLRGTLRRRYVRCGKTGCHCAKGRGHGPIAYLSISIKGGRTKQISVAKEDYSTALALVRNYKRLSKILEKISDINRQLLSKRRAERKERVESD